MQAVRDRLPECVYKRWFYRLTMSGTTHLGLA